MKMRAIVLVACMLFSLLSIAQERISCGVVEVSVGEYDPTPPFRLRGEIVLVQDAYGEFFLTVSVYGNLFFQGAPVSDHIVAACRAFTAVPDRFETTTPFPFMTIYIGGR